MSEHIATRHHQGVLTITIDRPEKKNALTLAMYDALTAALAEAASRADIRVALLAGAGGAFTAGNDLADFVANPPGGPDSPVFRFLEAVSTFEKPLLAAVEGPAVGIGTTVLLHCDVVYAARGARLALPFVNLGLCPEAASSYLLPLAVGLPKAAAWLLFGEPFTAEEAHAAGLVHEVVDADALLAHATDRAEALARRPPASLRLTKRLLREGHAEATRLAMRTEAEHFLARLQSEEAAEAFTAFFDKRPADFSRFS